MRLKLSLTVVLFGVLVFGYGWLNEPAQRSLPELLMMTPELQQAYFDESKMATVMQLCGSVLVAGGLIAFVIIRSVIKAKSR